MTDSIFDAEAAGAEQRPPRARRQRSEHARGAAATALPTGELIAAGCAVALLILLLATAWFGVAGVPDPSFARPAVSGTETGWQGLSVVRWILLATALTAIAALGLRLSQRGHGRPTESGGVVAALGLLSSLLLIDRVLIELPSNAKVIDQKLGAVLGVLCALGVAVGGHESSARARDIRRTTAPSRRHRRPTAAEPADK